MKALARKRRKGGRPKIADVDREPNGRVQRVSIDGEYISKLELEAITWRRRQIDPSLTPEEARKQEHGSVIAAWLERSNKARKARPNEPHPNAFTQLHYDTALRYGELHQKWLIAIDAGRVRSSSEFGGIKGHAPDPFISSAAKRDAKTIADFKAARRAILECGSPLGMMAIETIVLENQDADGMRGDLRQALNALARIWGLQAAA